MRAVSTRRTEADWITQMTMPRLTSVAFAKRVGTKGRLGTPSSWIYISRAAVVRNGYAGGA